MTTLEISVGVRDDGSIYFKDADGNPLSKRLETEARKQHGDSIRGLLEKKCEEINAHVDAIGDLHLETPDPREKPAFERMTFTTPVPAPPPQRRAGLMAKIFKSVRLRIEKENAEAVHAHAAALSAWQSQRDAFESSESARAELIERGIYSDPIAMESFLEARLQEITWPRETTVAVSLLDEGRTVFIDVDLPEIEDMPCKTATLSAKTNRLSVKDMAPTHVQRLYMKHVHAIGFRIIGETFAALPVSEVVVLSGFSQRPDAATGQVMDQYLYSVRVLRELWSAIDFERLEHIEVVEALTRFDLRRTMSKAGVFKSIEPFSATEFGDANAQLPQAE